MTCFLIKYNNRLLLPWAFYMITDTFCVLYWTQMHGVATWFIEKPVVTTTEAISVSLIVHIS